MLNELFIKPIIIQLTLKEVEIGIDLSLLDTIKMEWTAFNQYDKLAELEVLNKKVELAQNLSNFGDYTDVNGNQRKAIPLLWITRTFLDFTKEQLDSMEKLRQEENVMLGFNPDGSTPEGLEEDAEMTDDTEENDEMTDDEMTDDNMESISEMVRNGDLDKETLKYLIDNNQLSEDEIQELRDAGLLPEESAKDIANSDDEGYE